MLICDTGEETLHCHCSCLPGERALQVSRVIFRRCLEDGLEMAGHSAMALGKFCLFTVDLYNVP